MKTELEFMYKNVEIKITRFFGYNYHFWYANKLYQSEDQYLDIEYVKLSAKLHVDQIIRKDGDDLNIGV